MAASATVAKVAAAATCSHRRQATVQNFTIKQDSGDCHQGVIQMSEPENLALNSASGGESDMRHEFADALPLNQAYETQVDTGERRWTEKSEVSSAYMM